MPELKLLRAGSRLGKYRIEKRLGEGAFATVYRAYDTLEGLRVALKIPFEGPQSEESSDPLRKEIKLAAKLRHPRVLPLKSADLIDGRVVLVYPLGEKSLDDRLRSRLSLPKALEFTQQMLEGIAYAHDERVIHCDIKPDNLLILDGELRLADFGIAKVATRTFTASGSGTIGFCAPEQAMGKPSYRSDVFSAGLVVWRMVSGQLPEWPFAWPPPGADRVKKRLSSDFMTFIRRSIELDPKKRFATGGAMLAAFKRVRPKALRESMAASERPPTATGSHWQEVQWRQFQRAFGSKLQTTCECGRCGGPVSEAMAGCPWCGAERAKHDGETRLPQCCPRCRRGLKSDWLYCPWCYGPGFEVTTKRAYSDRRYVAKCNGPRCHRKDLMAFMRYCPWCHKKVQRQWKIEGSSDKCARCNWGVASEFWSFCPWCVEPLTS